MLIISIRTRVEENQLYASVIHTFLQKYPFQNIMVIYTSREQVTYPIVFLLNYCINQVSCCRRTIQFDSDTKTHYFRSINTLRSIDLT